MAVKRRTIWMTDEEWARMGALAELRHATISQMIRDGLENPTMVVTKMSTVQPVSTEDIEDEPALDAARQAVGRAIGSASFSTRPFTPVPKRATRG